MVEIKAPFTTNKHEPPPTSGEQSMSIPVASAVVPEITGRVNESTSLERRISVPFPQQVENDSPLTVGLTAIATTP
jgi:hypothetical protein